MNKHQKMSELKEQRERTLKVRLPNVIKDKKDIENLFVGDFVVKLPRQSSRSCRVVFSSLKEKLENHKLAKNKTVNGKRILVKSLSDFVPNKESKKVKTKKKKKKVLVPNIKPDIKVTQTIFISNIAINTKAHEIKGTLPGCVSVTLLKPYNKNFRSAIIKMESIQIAAEYLRKDRKWPVLSGNKMLMKSDTRVKHKRRASTSTIKIYSDDATVESKSKEKHKSSDCIENNDENS